jgi:hypothetical protein
MWVGARTESKAVGTLSDSKDRTLVRKSVNLLAAFNPGYDVMAKSGMD